MAGSSPPAVLVALVEDTPARHVDALRPDVLSADVIAGLTRVIDDLARRGR